MAPGEGRIDGIAGPHPAAIPFFCKMSLFFLAGVQHTPVITCLLDRDHRAGQGRPREAACLAAL
jgi:hypothetical protein